MVIKFRERFDKDLDEISDKIVRNEILKVVENVANASKPQDIRHLKKLKGDQSAYRIKIGRYRIGVYIVKNVVELTRVLPRNEIYRYFPK